MTWATTIPVNSDPSNKSAAAVILAVFVICLLIALFKK